MSTDNMNEVWRSKPLSWADSQDQFDRIKNLVNQDWITMQDFAFILKNLIGRVEMDVTDPKPALFYEIDGTYIDFMMRVNHIIVSISRNPDPINLQPLNPAKPETPVPEDKWHQKGPKESTDPKSNVCSCWHTQRCIKCNGMLPWDNGCGICTLCSCTTSSQQPVDTHEDEWQTVTHKKDPKRPKESTDPKSDTVQETKAPEDEWKTVTHKKGPKRPKDIFVFRDEANSAFIDFIGKAQSVEQMKDMIQGEMWAHGFTGEQIYDFNDCTKPGKYRQINDPNEVYLEKFRKWHESWLADQKDERVFYLFWERSTWDEWRYVGEFKGMAETRKKVKQHIMDEQWAHAYDPSTNTLVNFSLVGNTLVHKEKTPAPEKYVQRFNEFIL